MVSNGYCDGLIYLAQRKNIFIKKVKISIINKKKIVYLNINLKTNAKKPKKQNKAQIWD